MADDMDRIDVGLLRQVVGDLRQAIAVGIEDHNLSRRVHAG